MAKVDGNYTSTGSNSAVQWYRMGHKITIKCLYSYNENFHYLYPLDEIDHQRKYNQIAQTDACTIFILPTMNNSFEILKKILNWNL